MYNDKHLANATAQYFREPICYNPMFARALSSTKSAILVDYILKRKSLSLPFPSNSDIQHDLHMSKHEAKSTLHKLEQKQILINFEGKQSLDPFFMETLTCLAEKAYFEHYHLPFELLTSVEINRLHLQTLKSIGGSVNSAILLSFILELLPYSDRVNHNNVFSEWIKSEDSLWVGKSGMSRMEIRNAKQILRKIKLIEMKKVGFPGQFMIRLNIDLLCQISWEFTQQNNIDSFDSKYSFVGVRDSLEQNYPIAI